jgi:hypothetical protein
MTTQQTITRRDAIRLLTKYADAQPDNTPECIYVDSGSLTPVCVVGQVLVNDLSVEPLALEPFNSAGAAGLLKGECRPWDNDMNSFMEAALPDGLENYHFTAGAIELFAMAQTIQDHRHPDYNLYQRNWGFAVPEAIRITSKAYKAKK